MPSNQLVCVIYPHFVITLLLSSPTVSVERKPTCATIWSPAATLKCHPRDTICVDVQLLNIAKKSLTNYYYYFLNWATRCIV